MLSETVLNFIQNRLNFGSSGASKAGDFAVGSFAGELELPFADFGEFGTPLNEGVYLSEDGIEIEVPFFLFSSFSSLLFFLSFFFVDESCGFFVDVSPLSSTFYGVSEVLHAFFDVSV